MLPWFSKVHRSQKTSKHGKNMGDTCKCTLGATFLFIPYFQSICNPLLNRHTTKQNIFVKIYSIFSKICLLALQDKIKLGYLQYLLYLPGICGCVKPLHRPGLVFFNENSRKAFETLLWEVSTSTFPLHSQRKKRDKAIINNNSAQLKKNKTKPVQTT